MGGKAFEAPLFANSLPSQDWEKWLRKLKFIEIYFSGKVGKSQFAFETFAEGFG